MKMKSSIETAYFETFQSLKPILLDFTKTLHCCIMMFAEVDNAIFSQLILEATSNMAAVEVGGGPWFSTWKGRTSMPELVRYALQVPIDVDSFFPIPVLKPPGL